MEPNDLTSTPRLRSPGSNPAGEDRPGAPTQPYAVQMPYHETNPGHESATRWYHLLDLLPVLRRIKPYAWAKDSALKYIGLRYDTRTGHALITDCDGKPIHVERLLALGIPHSDGTPSP